ncbi:MAG: trigger factor [Sulfurihydrogenibium sp.]|nr:trigger factor [Sulfurihydrogenibium sp.]
MNVTVEAKGLLRTLTIEDEGQKVKELVEEVIKEISKVAEVKGFRKGHVPKAIIKAKYKDAIKEEVAKAYINKYLPEILEKENLKPVTPEILFGDVNLENDEKLSMKVSFEVAPEFELKPYEGIEVEVVKLEVKDEDVENAIKNILENHVRYEDADKEIEDGDKVKIKYHIISDKGEEEDEFEAIIGSGTLRKEIEDAIKGKKVGDKVELENVPLYNEKGEEIGKAKIELEILEVKRKVVPEFNDEFVKSIGLGENVEEAKNKIRENIENQLKALRKQEIEQKILDKLAQEYDFPVPTSLLELEFNNLVQRYASQLESYGIKPNKEILEAARENLTITAINNVRVMLVLSKIAEKEGITVSDEELDAQISKLAQSYNVSFADMKEYLIQKGMLEGIKSDIARQKALDILVEKANIKEISKEELEAREKQENKEEQNG